MPKSTTLIPIGGDGLGLSLPPFSAPDHYGHMVAIGLLDPKVIDELDFINQPEFWEIAREKGLSPREVAKTIRRVKSRASIDAGVWLHDRTAHITLEQE